LCDFVTDKNPPISYTEGKIQPHYLKGDIEMNPFITFMASPTGRIVRIAAGLALVVWGLLGLSSAAGILVIVIGAVPLLAGLFDFCVFAPLFGSPLSGSKIRAGK
jgi:hypothetical protein